MCKIPHAWNTFGSWAAEKVPSRCGAKNISKSKVLKSDGFRPLLEVEMFKKCTPCTFPSQNVQSTPCSEHFWKLRCRKSAHHCGAKHISKSKALKTAGPGPVLNVQMSFCVAGAKDFAPCQKWAKRKGFVAVPKAMASISSMRHLKRTCKDDQRCMLRGRRRARDMFIRDVRRPGRWFPEREIVRFAKKILHDRCSTSYDLASLFRGRKNRKTQWYEAVSSAVNFPFLKEVSHNCFVFNVVKFEDWGSLAVLFRFWHCQVQKLKKSRRIASFSTLQIDS